jgi:membrane protein DedA with SNARE-associated domain
MFDVGKLVSEWGYLAIFMIVGLGSLGCPVPEETVLLVSGYFAWAGDLELPVVIAVGVISTVTGDNVGYWIGRLYGQRVLGVIERIPGITPCRVDRMRAFLLRHGAVGVFVARFVAGLRFFAGPLAGMIGLRFGVFAVANLLGALVYVPTAVGIGYLIGNRIKAHGVVPVALGAIAVAVIAAWSVHRWRSRRLPVSAP